jgi:hypothetical protein
MVKEGPSPEMGGSGSGWNWARRSYDYASLPRVWSRRRPVNYPKQVEISGGIAAPLLLGFSLTTMTQLVIGHDHPWLWEYAITLFALAAALFVSTLQFTATSLSYNATPSERLDYNPEAAHHPEILRVIRARQWEEMELRAKYTSRAMLYYNFGLLAFLCGLGLILVPQQSWPWPWGQFAGVVIVGIALALAAITTFSRGTRPKWLLPTYATISPDPLPSEGAEYLFPHPESDEVMQMGSNDIAQNLHRCVELLEQIASRDQRARPAFLRWIARSS